MIFFLEKMCVAFKGLQNVYSVRTRTGQGQTETKVESFFSGEHQTQPSCYKYDHQGHDEDLLLFLS